MSNFLLYLHGDNRDLYSFPTRRSSDLLSPGERAGVRGNGVAALVILSECAQTFAQRLQEASDGPASRIETTNRKSTRLNSSHTLIPIAVFGLKIRPTPREERENLGLKY